MPRNEKEKKKELLSTARKTMLSFTILDET